MYQLLIYLTIDTGAITRAAEKRSATIRLIFYRYGDEYIQKAGDIFMLCTNYSINKHTNKSDWRTHVGFVSEDAKTINGQEVSIILNKNEKICIYMRRCNLHKVT